MKYFFWFNALSPQTARWKVTSKEALQRIGEYSEAAITIRGTYFPPGKEPKEGERKIYLAIESMFQRSLLINSQRILNSAGILFSLLCS